MSFGSTADLQNWAEDQSFDYELWTDDDRTLAIHYGAATASSFLPSRISVLLDGNGNQLLTYDVNLFGVGAHPRDVLDDARAIWGD